MNQQLRASAALMEEQNLVPSTYTVTFNSP